MAPNCPHNPDIEALYDGVFGKTTATLLTSLAATHWGASVSGEQRDTTEEDHVFHMFEGKKRERKHLEEMKMLWVKKRCHHVTQKVPRQHISCGEAALSALKSDQLSFWGSTWGS